MPRALLSWLTAWAFLCGAARAQAPNVLSPEERAEGFELLYDGTREGFHRHWVDYWKNDTTRAALDSAWQVDLASGAIGNGGRSEDVRSRRKFRDFDLRLEYRCDGNQGIFYRTLLTTDRAWQTGIEFAIDNITTGEKHAPGAAFDLFPPRPNTYRLSNTGEWNSVRILARADSIEHWMNGVKVVAFQLHSPGFWEAYSRSKWYPSRVLTYAVPGNAGAGYLREGYLGFQGDHGGKWLIRNIRIKDLSRAIPDRVRRTPAPIHYTKRRRVDLLGRREVETAPRGR